MTEEHDDQREWTPDEPDEEEVVSGKAELPPDPAGTQPKVDRDSLLPARLEDVEKPPPFAPPALPEPVGADDGDDMPVPVLPRAEAPHAAKFQFILGALLAVGLVGLAALGFVLAGQSSDSRGAGWSSFKPTSGGIEGAQQIADHVSRQYRLSNGEQMAVVTAHEFEVELDTDDVPMRVAVQQRREEGGEVTVEEGDAVLYRFCGLGDRCSLRGTPSQARKVLLRREALELALYSLRYLDIDQVVMFMPPSFLRVEERDTNRKVSVRLDNQALRFERSDLEPLLEAPLSQSLPAPPPKVREARESPDADLVANLTIPHAFTYRLVPGNAEEQVFLVLEQLNDQEALLRQRELALQAQKEAAAAGSGGAESEGDQ